MCRVRLESLKSEELLTCYFCGEQYKTRTWCPEGHYVCQSCYHKPISSFIEEVVGSSKSKDPFDLAAVMMAYPSLPECSCEHSWILAAAVLTAVKNEGIIKITNSGILDALEAVKEQAITSLAHRTGVCGVIPAVGVVFHAVLKAAGGGDSRDTTTMKVVAQAIDHLASHAENCICCKSVVWTTMDLLVSLLRARFGISLEGSAEDVICHQVGMVNNCNPSACQYSVLLHT